MKGLCCMAMASTFLSMALYGCGKADQEQKTESEASPVETCKC